MDLIFIVLGVALLTGIAGMTWLFPLLAGCFSHNRVSPFPALRDSLRRKRYAPSIAVLIPVHNQAKELACTLKSILEAAACARARFSFNFAIYVAADGCSDQTAKIAAEMGVNSLISKERCGKWKTICKLIDHCPGSDWYFLADAGVIWPPDFLSEILPDLGRDELMAISPAYRNPSGGLLERFLWKLESHFKQLESGSGGPVSVHGATVAYRAKELLPALRLLGVQGWLNDDVVVPLTLRAMNRDKKILYCNDIEVYEFPRPQAKPEFGRRKRMAIGNAQWIMNLWWPLWRINFPVALTASRRVFRLFWAYWAGIMLALPLIIILADMSWEVSLLAVFSLALLGVMAARSLAFQSLAGGAAASLMAPVYLLNKRTKEEDLRLWS